MKRKKFIRHGMITLLCAAAFVSCFNDVDLKNVSKDISLMEYLVLPIGRTTIKLDDLLEGLLEDEHVVQQNDSIIIRFSDEGTFEFREIDLMENIGSNNRFDRKYTILDYLTTSRIAELLNVSESTVQQTLQNTGKIEIPANIVPEIDVTIHDTLDLSFNQNSDERIDSLIMSKLRYKLAISQSGFENIEANSIDVKFRFEPEYIRMLDGNPRPEITFDMDDFERPKQVDVSRAMVKVPQESKGIPFEIDFKMNITHNMFITTAAKFTLDHEIADLDYEVIYGKFAPDMSYANSMVTNIEFPSDFIENAFVKLANPELTLTLANGIGAGINFQIDYLKLYTEGVYNDTVKAQFPNESGTGYTHYKKESLTARPLFYGDSPGIQTFGPYNKDNGSTYLFFEKEGFSPDKLAYSFTVNNSIESAYPDFIAKNSNVELKMDIKIPMQLNAGSYFSYTDTITDVANSVTFDADVSADSISLHLKVTNGLPVTAALRLELFDSSWNQITSSLSGKDFLTIYAAEVDNDGKVTKNNVQDISVRLTRGQYEDLKKSEYMKMNFRLDGKTKDNTQRPIFLAPSNELSVVIGVGVSGVTASLEDL